MTGTREKQRRFFLAAFFLCAWFCLAPGAQTMAAQTGTEQQPGDLVTIRVDVQQEETDREALLDRINAIRREACEEGVDNPVNGIPLTIEDYVPLQWSEDLEKIAALRAVESTILQDHVRPDGTECFTAAPEGISFTMETLAWGFESAADAVEGWYSEKSSYVNADGKPAGHYMALINPRNRFAGIAGLSGKWQRNACAGARLLSRKTDRCGRSRSEGTSCRRPSEGQWKSRQGGSAGRQCFDTGEMVWITS